MSDRYSHNSQRQTNRQPTPRGRHSIDRGAARPSQPSGQRTPATRGQHSSPTRGRHSIPSPEQQYTRPPRSNRPRRASEHRTSYQRAAAPQTARTYRTSSYQARRSKLPLLAAIIALVALVALVAFGIHSCAGCSSNDSQGASGASDAQQAASTENDGSLVLTLIGDEDTVVLKGESYIEGGCQAFDKNGGVLTRDVQVEGEVDTSQAGDYQVTYRVVRDDGVSAERVRNVHVVDTMDADTDGIPVMMYHHIYTDDDPPSTDDTNYLHADKLKEQLKWLQKNDYYYPSFAELRAYVDGTHSLPAKSVVLTFDDGQMGFFKHGVPLLNKYKVPATSFVIGDRSRTPKAVKKYPSEYVCFQSHSYGLHNDGSDASVGRGGIIYDYDYNGLVEDATKMGELIGPYDAMAYPYGDVSDEAPAALQAAGVKCAFTIVYGNTHPGDDPMRLNRVRVFGESTLDSWIYQVQTGEE